MTGKRATKKMEKAEGNSGAERAGKVITRKQPSGLALGWNGGEQLEAARGKED